MRLRMILLIIVTLIALQNCSNKQGCINQHVTYRIDKIPQVDIKINNNGGLNKHNTKKVRRLVRQLRYVEDYYYNNSTDINITN